MPSPNQADPKRTAKVLWMANLTAVMFITCLIYFLPSLIEIQRLDPVLMPILVIGILSLIPAFLAGKLTGATELQRMDSRTAQTQPQKAQKLMGRYAVAGALAELPVMFGMVYAVMGGESLHSMLLAAAAMVATFALRPE